MFNLEFGRTLARTSDKDYKASAVDNGARHVEYQVASFSATEREDGVGGWCCGRSLHSETPCGCLIMLTAQRRHANSNWPPITGTNWAAHCS